MTVDLLHIDCMAYMATLPDKAFDLAIVETVKSLVERLERVSK